MTDLRMILTSEGPDLSLVDQDLELDHGLTTPALVSLFSDARREESDPPLTEPTDDPRGWWPDEISDRFGSKLWLYYRSKITESTLGEIRARAEEAFAWMVREGIAQSVAVDIRRLSVDALALTVSIVRGSAQRWPQLWEGVGDIFTVGPITDRFLND